MKKFHWLKMPDDFFASPLIKKLRKAENGDACVIAYQKLLLFSVRDGGFLTFDGIEDDFSDELALKIDECPDNIKTVMAFMQKHGLICEVENAEFRLTEAARSLGVESEAAERMRQNRGRQKRSDALPEHCSERPEHCSERPEHCSTEKEKEKEKEGEEGQTPPRENAQGEQRAKSRTEKAELAEILKACVFGEPLDSAVSDWLKYKAEKKQGYKPAGLKSLLAQIGCEASLHGAEAVAAAIAVSMASNYQGIIWDRIGGPGHADARASPGGPARRTLETRNEKNNRVLDELFAENARMFGKGGGDVAGRLEVLP